MWQRLSGLFDRRSYEAYSVCQGDKKVYFPTCKQALIFAESLEDASVKVILWDNVPVAWKLPKRMGTWTKHYAAKKD